MIRRGVVDYRGFRPTAWVSLRSTHPTYYGLTDGLVNDLGVTVSAAEQLDDTFLYDE